VISLAFVSSLFMFRLSLLSLFTYKVLHDIRRVVIVITIKGDINDHVRKSLQYREKASKTGRSVYDWLSFVFLFRISVCVQHRKTYNGISSTCVIFCVSRKRWWTRNMIPSCGVLFRNVSDFHCWYKWNFSFF
jgi:hypothetical protein